MRYLAAHNHIDPEGICHLLAKTMRNVEQREAGEHESYGTGET